MKGQKTKDWDSRSESMTLAKETLNIIEEYFPSIHAVTECGKAGLTPSKSQTLPIDRTQSLHILWYSLIFVAKNYLEERSEDEMIYYKHKAQDKAGRERQELNISDQMWKCLWRTWGHS